jgi:hypothetical protein
MVPVHSSPRGGPGETGPDDIKVLAQEPQVILVDEPAALTDAALHGLVGAAPQQSEQAASTATLETAWVASP